MKESMEPKNIIPFQTVVWLKEAILKHMISKAYLLLDESRSASGY
jgi:hypothetical protein